MNLKPNSTLQPHPPFNSKKMSDKITKIDLNGAAHVTTLNGMYQDYFLDYASYVILERAVPSVWDGLKPVQRRILHALKEMDDGRYHKIANVIGQTMQYHPHGDAAIGEALVNLGQKELLIDPQGNWGDVRTGDDPAAPRYIEGRLTKFALEVAFNPQTTEWQMTYDGRKREPIDLPMKFPLLLAQGAEGIAVGLSTKILPHNFVELIKASIQLLKGKDVQIFPDFILGGSMDVTDYQGGKRGGRVKIRAKIEAVDKSNLVIKEIPYGTTTGSIQESIVKATEKGKIKIKKVTDNTAKDVEIAVELAPGTSPDVTIDALYAFTDCEVSISPNACVIIDDKPHFLTVEEILKISTEHTKELLRKELEIQEHELMEKWLFASLEKIFIEKRIYRQIEECETWEAVIETIDKGLRKYILTPNDKPKPNDTRLKIFRDITEDDIVRLTEIKIKRISKFNSFKADELIADLEKQLADTRHHLEHLTDYAIAYFENLLKKYGKGRERRTTIATFGTIQATEVAANNAKLYVDRAEGFIGWGLKKDEFVADCSDIDDIIVFRRDGKFQVVRIGEKVFVGKDIIHVAVWKKGDDRTTYNLAYVDAGSGRTLVKRFNVTAITRSTEYDLTAGAPNSKVHYFSANLNGEAEVITVYLTAGSAAKIKTFDFDFSELLIKGRSSQGNVLTKYPVRKITLKETGKSTIGAQQWWYDPITGKLNTDERGNPLGDFDTGDYLLALYKDGTFEVFEPETIKHFEPNDVLHLAKFDPETIVNAVHLDGNKGWTMVKRFRIEKFTPGQRSSYLSEHKDSKLLFASVQPAPVIRYAVRVKNRKIEGEVNLAEFMDVKGWKALGNRLSDQKLSSIKALTPEEIAANQPPPLPDKLQAGDSVEFEVPKNGKGNQGKLF